MHTRRKAVKVLCSIFSLVLLLGVGVITPDNIKMIAGKKHSVYVNTISKAVKNKAKKFPHVSGELPDWRGVNVVDKAEFAWTWAPTVPEPSMVRDTKDTVFKKAEAIEIAEAGYNFVRICLDTRFFFTKESKVTLENVGSKFYGNIKTANLTQYENLDKMIEWCIARGIHVCIDVHSTPGGLMIGGDEEKSRKKLFTPGSKEQKIFVEHWRRIAKRYKDIDTNALSFNLYNEPPNFVTKKEEVYVNLMNKAIDEIQKVSPNRLIFVDMLEYGRTGMTMLDKLHANNLVVSFHFYAENVGDGNTKKLDMESCLKEIDERLPGYAGYANENGVRWMLQEYGCSVYVKEAQAEEYYGGILGFCRENNVPFALWAYNAGDFGVATWCDKSDKYITPDAKYVKTSQGHRINKDLAELTSAARNK